MADTDDTNNLDAFSRAARTLYPNQVSTQELSSPQQPTSISDEAFDPATTSVTNVASNSDPIAFVGGADDSNNGPALRAYRNYQQRKGTATYFTWDQDENLAKWIDDNHGAVTVIGHSYGGDTAASVVADGHRVNRFITVDPVSWFPPNFSKVAANSGSWSNFNAAAHDGSNGDIIAGLGGAWNESPRGKATTFKNVDANHVGIMSALTKWGVW